MTTETGTAPAPAARIVHNLAELAGTGAYTVTIGRFDGVHRGHQHLLGLTARDAREQGVRSLAITFEPHPEQVFRPDQPITRLTTPALKAALLAASGVDVVAILPFSLEFSQQTAEAFVARLVASVRPRALWIGQDFAMGYKRGGTPARLAELGREHGFSVHAAPRIHLPGGEPISSSNIRQQLAAGNVALAAQLLGRPYALTGTVVHGAKRGRLIGYPTANLAQAPELLVPPLGVYATLVDVPGVVRDHAAMAAIGVRPVFDNGERSIEAHLLNWDGDLYDRPLALSFIEWLRPEEKFPSVDALVEQMGRDAQNTSAAVARYRAALTP